MPFRQFHLQSTTGDLYPRLTKQGKAALTRAKPSLPERPAHLAHDRIKRHPIPAEAGDTFLQGLGIVGPSGRVRAAMQGKFRQINEFLRLMGRVLPAEGPAASPIEIVDCGCGNAYLTFAAYHYLNHLRRRPARVVGIDANEEIIQSCTKLRHSLGWEGLEFHSAKIAEFAPPPRPISSSASTPATRPRMRPSPRGFSGAATRFSPRPAASTSFTTSSAPPSSSPCCDTASSSSAPPTSSPTPSAR